MPANGKVVVIGLDGATFRVLRPLAEAGVMPTVARFMREGASGVLQTTRPPVTCPAWPTLFTGVNPGKHGVFSFSHRDRVTGRVRTAASGDIRVPKLWDLLGAENRKSAILNVPITFPAERIRGVMLTGFVSPEESPQITEPPTLAGELRRELGELAMNWSILGYRPADRVKREAHISKINALLDLRIRQFDHITAANECDFCFMVHEYTDRVCHLYHQIIDPEYEAHRLPENRGAVELLHQGHRLLDDSIAELVRHFGKDTNFVLVSDHGFDGVHQWVYVNNLLQRHGWASLKNGKIWAEMLCRRLNVSVRNRQRMGLEQRHAWHRQDPARAPLIDYRRSAAFAGPQLEQAVYVNLKGRFSEGTVEPGQDYERVRAEIINLLKETVDPETRQPVFEGVWTREELYHGPYVEHAPDIIYGLARGYMTSNAILPPAILGNRFLRPLRSGWDISGYHRPEGVFVGWGPAFAHINGFEASIVDVAPTVLYLMDLPIPEYMDGEIIAGALREGLLAGRPPRTSEADCCSHSREAPAYTEQEQMDVTRRLEEMGYL